MLKPVPMTHAELTAVVKDMAAVVEAQDSFEGFIEYGMPDPEDGAPGDTFALVKASYRVGNSMGQGAERPVRARPGGARWVHADDDAGGQGAGGQGAEAVTALHGTERDG